MAFDADEERRRLEKLKKTGDSLQDTLTAAEKVRREVQQHLDDLRRRDRANRLERRKTPR